MVGAGTAGSKVETWVQEARRAATYDLLEQLSENTAIEQCILVSPTLDGLENAPVNHFLKSKPENIHVGQTLAQIVDEFRIGTLLYFGGGSAPLLDDETIDRVISKLTIAKQIVFSNNLHASDWAGIAPASLLGQWQDRLPLDNMIGWVLSTEAKIKSEMLAPSASSRLDIDTPADLLTLSLHPTTKPRLRSYLESLDLDCTSLVAGLRALNTQASQIFLAGRLGPAVWSSINRATSCWIRVISEERGMVSSGRLAGGEVYSLLAEYIGRIGIQGFFESLADFSDAAFIDDRVILAHQRRWPSRSDRFHSDLGITGLIEDPWLSEFTKASLETSIPILLGGHGLLNGDMLAFTEILESWNSDANGRDETH